MSHQSPVKVNVCVRITSVPFDSPFPPRAKHVLGRGPNTDILVADHIPSGDANSAPTTVTEKLTNCKPQQITNILNAIKVIADDMDSE